jgi:hypothetical protein
MARANIVHQNPGKYNGSDFWLVGDAVTALVAAGQTDIAKKLTEVHKSSPNAEETKKRIREHIEL